jgi:hypothetical protein
MGTLEILGLIGGGIGALVGAAYGGFRLGRAPSSSKDYDEIAERKKAKIRAGK